MSEQVFIALYRGLNVGGTGMVKMDALRAMHAGLGHSAVKTYVQSGNVVFRAEGAADGIAEAIVPAFAGAFGFAAKVMVRDAASLERFVAENPYAEAAAADPTKVHAAICEGRPDEAGLTALLERTGGPEQFVVGDGILYLHAPDGVGRSKFAAGMERAARVPLTARNWRTMEALQAMARDAAS